MTQTFSNEYVAEGDAQIRSGNTAWRHIRSEFTDSVPQILATLAPEGPFAYTPPASPQGPGEPALVSFKTTYEGIKETYEDMHRVVGVRDMRAVVEIRGDWYTFMYGQGEGLVRGSDLTVQSMTAVMFPTLGQEGITGELIWGSGAADSSELRARNDYSEEVRVLARHEELLHMLRGGDVDGIVKATHPKAQIGIRDYVTDSRTVTDIHDIDGAHKYLTAFYDRYNVRDIELVQRYASYWFVFSELRWTVEEIESNERAQFHTIEITDIGQDGVFRARIGHGTDLKSI